MTFEEWYHKLNDPECKGKEFIKLLKRGSPGQCKIRANLWIVGGGFPDNPMELLDMEEYVIASQEIPDE